MRSSRLITGLLTVWCLGCTSFESLLAYWSDSGASSQSCMTDSETSPQSGGGHVVRGDLDGNEQRDVCACGSQCTGAQPVLAVTIENHRVSLETPSLPSESVVKLDSEPLVPPPRIVVV